MKGKLLFLGTGSSSGIPVIGCNCEVCLSLDPLNKRMRPSVLLEVENKHLLIDPGPDFRAQALAYQVHHIDGVLITHTHFDHIGGLDDLRIFYFIEKHPIRALLSNTSYQALNCRLPYLFTDSKPGESVSARFDCHIIEEKRGQVDFLNIPISYMTYEQGGMEVVGFRFGNLAYIPDIQKYPETIFEDLQGVEVLIISALRHSKSYMHFTVDQAIEFSEKVQATSTFLTHIAHELDHQKLKQYLPDAIGPAYDGLEIEF